MFILHISPRQVLLAHGVLPSGCAFSAVASAGRRTRFNSGEAAENGRAPRGDAENERSKGLTQRKDQAGPLIMSKLHPQIKTRALAYVRNFRKLPKISQTTRLNPSQCTEDTSNLFVSILSIYLL